VSKTRDKFLVIWPERRIVAGDEIAIWYADAKANLEVLGTAKTNADKARELDDAGLITLGGSVR
jgi:hypothetical protein